MEQYGKLYVSMDGLKILQTAAEKSEPRVGEFKMENLADSSIVQKIDGSGFFKNIMPITE
jgi:hypothetical protein